MNNNSVPQLISIVASEALWELWSKDFYTENISARVNALSFSSQANGGYFDCSLTLGGNREYMDSWLNGIGRHIEIKDHNLVPVWEGFVNTITINMGPDSIRIGPLMNVANRVKVAYTVIQNGTVNPPVMGGNKETTFGQDTVSQGLYGIREKIVSGGNLLDDTSYNSPGNEAEQVRDAAIALMKRPEVARGLSYGDAGEVSINLECVGYYMMLDAYTYLSAATGYATRTAKILAVIAQDPNAVFNADVSGIETNAALTLAADVNRTARSVIEELVAMGDVSQNRWIWGVGSDRKIYYRTVSQEVVYLIRDGIVYDLYGQMVYPWQVQAGVWAYIANSQKTILPGSLISEDDPFGLFIESVSYTLPFTAQISSSRVSSFEQLLLQKGIGIG